MNIGFVLRTDIHLNEIWTIEIDNTGGGTNDFNMVNNIIETNDGYFITGAVNDSNSSQQAIMAHKIDETGANIWDSSYVVGNAMDVSVDAYYDAATNFIYMLSNYSVYHHFGVTVLNNSTGNISQNWVALENNGNLDYYGFTINESLGNSNHIVITGYSREFNWTGLNGNSITSQSNIFVHKIDKTTGAQQGHTKIYKVPHTEMTTDDYNFWNGQMPLIYYPEISDWLNFSGTDYHNVVGYFTQTNNNARTQINLYRTLSNFESICSFDDLNFIPNQINITHINNVMSGPTPINTFSISSVYNPISYTATNCFGEPLSIIENNFLDNNYLYPNPVNDKLFVIDSSAIKYQIYDIQGRLMSNGVIHQDSSIKVDNLKKGVYFVKIFGNNQTKIFKVIKK